MSGEVGRQGEASPCRLFLSCEADSTLKQIARGVGRQEMATINTIYATFPRRSARIPGFALAYWFAPFTPTPLSSNFYTDYKFQPTQLTAQG